jgi:sn-glycerol 3-phosphate transport system ATP-binding protein
VRVEIKGVSKWYGGRGGHRALAGVSLMANDGEFLVLLGPSGSGKTTLLRSIAGLETVDEGEIAFGGRRVNELEPGARNIGMVFQDYALYPHFTVSQNIAYNMKIRRIPPAEITRRVAAVATMLGIQDYLDRKPSALSGGQRQRVAVARAITRDASVLLMDEPLSNLDAQIREHVRVELRELQRRLAVTTIYVTHDQVEAMVVADRIAVMDNGAIEQLGSPDQVYSSPETLFCARFVGSPKINELSGELRAGPDGRSTFVLGGSQDAPAMELTLDAPLKSSSSQDVILAFRAEDADVAGRDVSSSAAQGVPVRVTFVENRGAERFVVGGLPDALRAAQVSADVRVRIAASVESASEIAVVPSRFHLFDKASGKRLASGSGRRAEQSAGARPAQRLRSQQS